MSGPCAGIDKSKITFNKITDKWKTTSNNKIKTKGEMYYDN